MPRPLVSVVVPCFNYGGFVTDCVRSVLDNAAVDLEVLVIDDASTDDSWQTVQQLPALDPRIRVLRNPVNRGLIATANAGLDAVAGEYVVLLSADDALAPGWLDDAVAAMEANPDASFALGPVRTFAGRVPTPRRRPRPKVTVRSGTEWIARAARRGVTPARSPEVVVRTSAQRAVGGYSAELPYSSDMEMWLRLASIGRVVEVKGRVAAWYRVSRQSMSRGEHMHLLRELRTRADAFDGWSRRSAGVSTELLDAARRTLARRAVRRAGLALLQEPEPVADGLFEGLCALAVDRDPGWARRPVRLLTAVRARPATRRAVAWALPVTRGVRRVRALVPQVRARLPFA